MSRQCMITGRSTTFGNNVSHAINRTRRKFLTNLRKLRVDSVGLGRSVNLRVSARGVRTLDKHGGLDAWLLSTKSSKMTPEALRLKHEIKRRQRKISDTPVQVPLS